VIGPTDADLEVLRGACAAGAARHAIVRGDTCVLAVPIKATSSVIGGLLLVGAQRRVRADASDLTFLEGFAAGMGVAIDRARLAEQEHDRLERERRRLTGEVKELRSALHQVKLVYDSPAVENVVFDARRVADTDATVLIMGESGTGKGLLAQTIHQVSRRRTKPLVVVDCSAIPANLIESELFGHERGAFTGAITRSPGRMVQADGGTLLLDEVGELPLEVQAKLLRFVEERKLTSVGSHVARHVDVRLLAATNRNLLREVDAGRFRLDLYHRLSVVPLELPPLRDRQQDVLLLARHFLASFAAKYQKPVQRISPELEQRMLAYPWPGNVRELQNRLLRAVLLADEETLTLAHLPLNLEVAVAATGGKREPATPTSVPDASGAPGSDASLNDALAAAVNAAADLPAHLRPPLGRWLADDLVLAAFHRCDGVACRAATTIGVPDTTYARRLHRAQRDATLGTRPAYWSAVETAIARLVEANLAAPASASLLDVAETALLEQIERRFPNDARAGATLLGTSLPTFRRRVTGMAVAC
jgi:transcriptional regulator with GAF, ATPase, and Fis domain